MTSISAIGSSRHTSAVSYSSGAAQARRQDPMTAVAKQLGMNIDDVRTALSGGRSLNDLATEKSVPHDDLIAAIKQGRPSDKASGTEAAEKIAATRGLPTPPPGGRQGPPPTDSSSNSSNPTLSSLRDSSKLEQLSSMLGTTSDGLFSQVSSAQDLIALLQNKGVSTSSASSLLDPGDLVDVSL